MRKNILFLLLLSLLFSAGCLKDEALKVDDNTSRVLTEFTNGDSSTLNTLAIVVSSGMQEEDLTELRIIPRSDVTQNVEVTIELNPGLVDSYNTENGTDYTVPDGTVFTFSNHNYTLTSTARTDNVKLSVDPSALVGNDYALGFTITSVSNGDIGLKKDYLVQLKAKNAFDGDYTSNGYVYHPTLPRDIIDRPKTLSTLTASSVLCELGDLGANNYFAVFDVDASNNVTITAAPGASGGAYTMFTSGLPSSNPGYTPQWPNSDQCNNTYDPVAQEFKVRYGYMGATGWRVTEEIIKRN
ncbi:MAG: DUF1735 domain-containing protein [Ferruginibacter sp.]